MIRGRLNVKGTAPRSVAYYAKVLSQKDLAKLAGWDRELEERFKACDHEWSEPQPIVTEAAAHRCARCDTWLYVWPWEAMQP